MNERTLGALSRMNVRHVIVTGGERAGLYIKPVAALLLFRTVAFVAGALKDRRNVLPKIHRALRGRREFREIDPGSRCRGKLRVQEGEAASWTALS
jgi:hypothetical protein